MNNKQTISYEPQAASRKLLSIRCGVMLFLLAACGLLLPTICLASEFKINRLKEGGYEFSLNGNTELIKGVGYNPTPIGKGYNYDFFSDENKPWLVDGKLMKEAGINCVRVYSSGNNLEKVKEFIKDMYENFGIYTAVSDWIGLWDYPRANYADSEFKEKTKQRILRIAETLKDEKGLLMWILGNENNYTFSGKIGFWTSEEIEKIEEPYQRQMKKAQIYYSFVNDIAKAIKEIDKNHLIALGNGESSFLSAAAEVCEDIDILSIIIYRGKKFGNLFTSIQTTFDKPVVLSEFGCDSYDAYKDKENQQAQADFLLSQWDDLYKNTSLGENKKGNCVGGFIFEWNDEWWKHNEGYVAGWNVHNTEAGWSDGSYYFDIKAPNNMNMNEEWFGIVALSEEIENGINKRTAKQSFYVLKEFFSRLNQKD